MARQLSERISATSLQLYLQNARVVNRHGKWVLAAWLAALIDGKLLVAIATSALAYRLIESGYQLPRDRLAPIYQTLCGQLAQVGRSPLLAGTVAFASTYGFAAAWSELGGGWAATTLLALGLGNGLFILRETAEQSAPEQSSPDAKPASPSDDEKLDFYWQSLSAVDPLKRLIAVRSLLHWSLSSDESRETYLPGTDVTMRSHLIDCFRVMLTRETEPLVRSAIVEGLKALRPKPQLPAGQPAIRPLKARAPQVDMAARRTVEYVEP